MGWIPNPGSDADAIHDNVSGEIDAISEKATPVDADVLLIEDSEDTFAKKKVEIGNLPSSGGGDADAIHDNVDGEIDAITEKGSPVGADILLIEDSAASYAKKKVQITNLPTGGGSTRIGELGLTTPPTTGWSWINQGSATETVESEGSIVLVTPAVGSANLVGRVRTHSAPSTVTGRFNDRPIGNANSAVGLWMRESSTSKLVVFYIKPNGDVLIENWTNPTTFSASGASQAHGVGWRPIWLQIEDNSTNLIFRTSYTGFPDTWFQLSSVSRTAFLAGGPDETGWLLRDNSAAKAGILSSWTQV